MAGSESIITLGIGATPELTWLITGGLYSSVSTVTSNQSAYILGVAAQKIYADGDSGVSGNWKNELGGATLYTSIDEASPNDSDYAIHDNANINDYFEVTLQNPASAVGTGNIIVRWRAANTVAGEVATLKMEVREGANVRASDEQVLTDTITTYEYALTSSERASVTSWDAVTIRFTVTGVA